jgi:hypothetical protein
MTYSPFLLPYIGLFNFQNAYKVLKSIPISIEGNCPVFVAGEGRSFGGLTKKHIYIYFKFIINNSHLN